MVPLVVSVLPLSVALEKPAPEAVEFYAAAFGVAAASTLAGIALRTRVKIGGLVESGIELALTPLTWQPTASPRLRRLAPDHLLLLTPRGLVLAQPKRR